MRKIEGVTLGSDPELFLYSEKLSKFVPVCGLVGGTKHEPLPITDQGHALQEDNCALEFCIPPSKTKKEFIDNINFVKNYINDTVLKPLGLTSRYVSSARFDIKDLQSEQAQLFGCSESYNAWSRQVNTVDAKGDLTLRSSGTHIHVGYKDPNTETSLKIVKAFDLFLTVPSILLDTDTERRKLYGKAGEYRFKSYGVECRQLGGFLIGSDELLGWAWDSTMKAIDFVNEGGVEMITNEDDIIRCINTSDKDLAKEIIEDYRIVERLQTA